MFSIVLVFSLGPLQILEIIVVIKNGILLCKLFLPTVRERIIQIPRKTYEKAENLQIFRDHYSNSCSECPEVFKQNVFFNQGTFNNYLTKFYPSLTTQGLLYLDGRNCQKHLHQTKADFLTLIMLHKLIQSL